MPAENQEQFPPPPFDDADKTIVAPTDTPPEPPVVGEVGEAVSSNIETTLPESTVANEKAGNESSEGGEEDLTFDLLMELDKKNLKILLGKVSPTVLATSLSRMDTEAQDKVFGALSKTVVASLRAEIGRLGTLDDGAVEKAQDEIVEMAENMEENGTISLDALFEEESESVVQSPAQPVPPSVSKTIERKKTPTVERAEALADYFGEVESGTDFLAKIVNMRQSVVLRKSLDLPKIEKLSSELSLKVMNFFDLVDTWEREKKGRKEIMESGEDFIASAKIPSGCQGAFRTIMLFAVRHKLGSAVETLKASPVGKPSETPPEAKTSPSLSSQDILANYKASKAAVPGVPEGAPTGEALKPTPTPEGESESFLVRIRDRGARLFHSTRKSMPETPPVVPTTTPTVEVAPAPSPVVESAPVSSEERIKALTFEEVLKLAPENLQKVLQHTNIDIISAALTDMSPQYIEYVRQSLSEEDRVHFDRLRSLELLNTQVVIDAARRKIVEVAQGLLKEEKVSSVAPSALPEKPTAPTSRVESTASEKISESWTPERINALTFEGLADLNDVDLRLVVRSSHATPIGWGLIVQGMPDEFVQRVRGIVNAPLQFDDWINLEEITDDHLRESRGRAVKSAKEELLEALQRKNPPQS